MSSQPHSGQSLSSRIFRSVLLFTLLVVLGLFLLLANIFYASHEKDAEALLMEQTQKAAAELNAVASSEQVRVLDDQLSGEERSTLISSAGDVLYDSSVDAALLENHADRPEVKGAEENGQAITVRYSDTLRIDTIYSAVQLENGNVFRLSETRQSFLAFLSTMVTPLVIALVLTVVLVLVLSRLLTKRIMKPIDALDFREPLQNEIYEEMTPLLERIDEQQVLLKQQNKELALAESMRRDFSSNVSHEMKTPLQVISGYAELLKTNMAKPDDSQRFAELIYDEAQSMRLLIDDVLTLSRLDELAVNDSDQEVDLFVVAVRVIDRLQAFAETNDVQLFFEGEEDVFITGSQTMIEQIVYNLIENGIRYNQPGGQVILTLITEEGGPTLSVRDTGCGIPEDMQDKIFERFFRMDKSRSKETGGTGLGLAIVKHGIAYHGGTVQVESEEGRGTTFVLRFPAHP